MSLSNILLYSHKQLGNLGKLGKLAGATNQDLLLFVFPSRDTYTYRVLQTIQVELILLCVWAEPAVLGSAKTALEFKYEI